MSVTRELAEYIAKIQPGDLSERTLVQAKLLVIDALGNAIGGLPFDLARTFSELAAEVGGGTHQATIIGGGGKVSIPGASFANTALSTMLDYSDFFVSESGRCPIWVGPLVVPAALAAGESTRIPGAEFLASVVAGYECAARIQTSMDMSVERAKQANGETLSVFGALGGAGRALRLSEDEMLSAIGMAAIYTPVPAIHKWSHDAHLTPRRDIKQGWAWMSNVGAFAAVSAKRGLRALQTNNVLDGDLGLWRMLGMDSFNERAITSGMGSRYYIDNFITKGNPGCHQTFCAAVGLQAILRDEKIDLANVKSIVVGTDRLNALDASSDERDIDSMSVVDKEFSLRYQAAAAAVIGMENRGPRWYGEEASSHPDIRSLMSKIRVSYDEESEKFRVDNPMKRREKITIETVDGGVFSEAKTTGSSLIQDESEIRQKFNRTVSQVVGKEKSEEILQMLDHLDEADSICTLASCLGNLRAPVNGAR